jgi:putative ABC transport system ATP-binding protein
LDSDSAGAILDLLFELVQNNGRTIVLSTHDNRIAERCARRLHLKDGKMHPH